jgi:hypothetical protein
MSIIGLSFSFSIFALHHWTIDLDRALGKNQDEEKKENLLLIYKDLRSWIHSSFTLVEKYGTYTVPYAAKLRLKIRLFVIISPGK